MILGIIYFSVLISTVVFSFRLPKIIFAAAVIFAFSDLFMFFNMFSGGTIVMLILALLVYYFSLFLYGWGVWRINHPGERI